jgi:hypothetical protein
MNKIQMVAKMYEARDTVLFLLGTEKFKAKVEEYRPFIEGVMKRDDCSEIAATVEICNKLAAAGHDGMPVLLVLAVCVEIMEPTQEICCHGGNR